MHPGVVLMPYYCSNAVFVFRTTKGEKKKPAHACPYIGSDSDQQQYLQ